MTSALSEQTVAGFVEEWRRAEEDGDPAALEKLLADDFVGVGPRGFLRSRAQWIARYSSGTVRNASFRLSDARVRTYGPTAVVVAAQTQESVNGDADASGAFRFTLVVVRGAGGQVRLAGVHVSPNAAPAAG
ncbi:nuclear transport factor 2 family protein [Streptomyces cyaneogriseus]|uniref:nuclear transport factor 2 family protein n=1 Tax=Streptomyces cyaneogriseus TaxID=68192 RepID=UPI0005CA6D23|nr:nuclear transport factor 2 family protein [Streptomyces cyaneogriseus]